MCCVYVRYALIVDLPYARTFVYTCRYMSYVVMYIHVYILPDGIINSCPCFCIHAYIYPDKDIVIDDSNIPLANHRARGIFFHIIYFPDIGIYTLIHSLYCMYVYVTVPQSIGKDTHIFQWYFVLFITPCIIVTYVSLFNF